MRVESVVEFVVPGNYRPSEAGEEQEAGHEEADPAMEEDEIWTH